MFRRLDFIGCFLLLGSSALLVSCLEEAGLQYRWSSTLVIVLLVLCAVLWLAFAAWEWFITKRQESALGPESCAKIFHDSLQVAAHLSEEIAATQSKKTGMEPVFPWRFARNRVFMAMLTCAFAAGIPFTVSIISIPQRLQIVNSLSAFDASVRLLPFTLGMPFGSVMQSTLAKRGVVCVYLLIAGGLFQVAGVGAQLRLPTDITASMYAEQLITGIGVGINLGILILWTPFQAKGADTSVGMSAITQIRALGGVVGIAIVTNILKSHLRHALVGATLPPIALNALLESPYAIATLPIGVQGVVREVFADAYRKQLRAVLALSVVQVLCVSVMIERKLRKVV